MGIGLSNGAFHDDEFRHVAAPYFQDPMDIDPDTTPDIGSADKNVIKPNPPQDPSLIQKIGMTNTDDPFWNNVPKDQIARLSRQPSNIMKPQSHDPFKGGSVTPSGVSQMRSPANDNTSDVELGLDFSSLDSHFNSNLQAMKDEHEDFITKYDALHEYGNFITDNKENWTELNVARYNKMGRELNPDWEGIPFKSELDKQIEEGRAKGDALADAYLKGEPLPTPEKPEKIKSAALRIKGELFEAPNHGMALNDYTAKYPNREIEQDFSKPFFEEGFTTTKGRFIDREEAMTMAKKEKQLNHPDIDHPNNTTLLSEDLQPQP